MNSTLHLVLLILVATAVTFTIRALPFLIFNGKRKMPPKIRVVADSLPPAVVAVLVVFCVKNELLSLGNIAGGISTNTIAAFVSIALVVVVHLWKKNTLLSIFAGTALYMVLIRFL